MLIYRNYQLFCVLFLCFTQYNETRQLNGKLHVILTRYCITRKEAGNLQLGTQLPWKRLLSACFASLLQEPKSTLWGPINSFNTRRNKQQLQLKQAAWFLQISKVQHHLIVIRFALQMNTPTTLVDWYNFSVCKFSKIQNCHYNSYNNNSNY